MVTVTPVFSVRIVATPSRTCWRPERLRIAPTQPSVEHHARPTALFGADRATPSVWLHIVLGPYRKPGGFGRDGFFMPDVASVLTWPASTAQRKPPRTASRKFRTCAGVSALRSRPKTTCWRLIAGAAGAASSPSSRERIPELTGSRIWPGSGSIPAGKVAGPARRGT